MLLINSKGTAVHDFPCPVCIIKNFTRDGGQYWAICCGGDTNFCIAKYGNIIPAKLELLRLIKQYHENPNEDFIFAKDPDDKREETE